MRLRALAYGEALGIGVTLIDGYELRAESQPNDCNIYPLSHIGTPFDSETSRLRTIVSTNLQIHVYAA
jgi:hypothetical protein